MKLLRENYGNIESAPSFLPSYLIVVYRFMIMVICIQVAVNYLVIKALEANG